MKKKLGFGFISMFLCLTLLGIHLPSYAEEMVYETQYVENRAYQDGYLGEAGQSVALMEAMDRSDAKRAIKEALLEYKDTVNIAQHQVPSSAFTELMNDLINENPELYYVNISGISGYSVGENIFLLDLSNAYRFTEEVIKEKNAMIEKEINHIMATIDREHMSMAEQALMVHDWFALHYAYDYERLESGTLPDASFRIDGLFIDKIAVCQGYALGYMYVLNRLGIPCVFVPSEPLHHAWHMVEIEGKWYHVDVTWDDPVLTGVGDQLGVVRHTNFLLSDADMIKSGHVGENVSQEESAPIWDSAYVAEETYKGFWQGANGAVQYKEGVWYYMRENTIYSFSGRTETARLENTAMWNLQGISYTPAQYCSNISVFKDRIYYNTNDAIRCIKLDGTDHAVFLKPEIGTYEIYGMYIENDMLYYVLSDGPSEKRILQEGIEMGFSFSAVRNGEKLDIITGGHVLENSNFFVAVYDGKELLWLDVLPIKTGETDYISTVPSFANADKIMVYAFSRLSPKEAAIQVPIR